MKCPICSGKNSSLFDQDKLRSYYKCSDCTLIFVSRDQILPAIDELKRYEAHKNSEEDPHYGAYLKQIVVASLPHLKKNARGLDFGCGKTTLLSKLYGESGLSVDSYDVFFHPEEMIWQKTYDFIVLSEVIEHLAQPLEVMRKLKGILSPTGQIFIKTKLYPETKAAFANWFYKRDATHVQFFSNESLETLAQHLQMNGPQALNESDLFLFFCY
jgi:cyclopropane fatty-acyl-phospholipid synthase-like methyltransferase